MIDIARGVSPLPENAVTQTFGIIGRKGSGKTYGAGKLVEQMLNQKSQVVILDPLGNWYGLRLSASGKNDGYDIPIIGGERGDVPINEHSGQLIADLVVDHGTSAVIDISQFSKTKMKQFVADFGEHLYERKKKKKTPVHLIIEEAHIFAPQRVDPGSARMVGAMENLVRLGRNFGIGVTMIDQRPQSVNKEVLNQVECLLTFQLTGLHERKAIKDWVVQSGADQVNMVDNLPSLKTGECFIWSPSWLEIFQRTKIKKKTTYDSTATPDSKDFKNVEARPLSDADLVAVKAKMVDLIEEQEANDPANLKRRIRELEKELSKKPVASIPDGYLAPGDVSTIITEINESWVLRVDTYQENLRATVDQFDSPQHYIPQLPEPKPNATPKPAPRVVEHRSKPAPPKASINDSTLTSSLRSVLGAIAWYESIGIARPSTSQIAIMADFSQRHTSNKLSELVAMDYVERGNGDAGLTEASRAIIEIPSNQSLDDLHASMLSLRCLSGTPSTVLGYIIEKTYKAGDGLTTQEIADGLGFSNRHTSNQLSRISSIGAIRRSNGQSIATEILYPRGLK